MAYKNDTRLKLARELMAQGKSVKYISGVTGLSIKTVYNYTSGMQNKELQDKAINDKMDCFMQEEWMMAVNRIRKYCGMDPLERRLEEQS